MAPVLHYVVKESSDRAAEVATQMYPGDRIIGMRDVANRRRETPVARLEPRNDQVVVIGSSGWLRAGGDDGAADRVA